MIEQTTRYARCSIEACKRQIWREREDARGESTKRKGRVEGGEREPMYGIIFSLLQWTLEGTIWIRSEMGIHKMGGQPYAIHSSDL